MISFVICKRCADGTYCEPSYNVSDEMEVCPHVECGKSDHIVLLMRDEPPKECPYVMEHAILTQYVSKEFANWMSGGAAKKTMKNHSPRREYEDWMESQRRKST